MYLKELFAFNQHFNEGNRVYTLSFDIPEASDIWSLFDEDTVSSITDDVEENLLKRFDSVFERGLFISMYDWGDDIELAEEIDDTCWEYYDDHKPSKLLGSWNYSREGRYVSLVWNVPEWFQSQGGDDYICDFQDIRSLCKDWYINSP